MDRQRPYPQTPSSSTQPPSGWLERLAAALRAAPAAAGATRVLAIDGRSGAGKSTLALALAQQLAAPVVSLEDLYGGWDGLEHGIELLRSAVLEPLAAAVTAQVPRYDWHRGEWGEPWPLEPPAELVVEGVGAGARELLAFTSVLIWLELDTNTRRKRALDERGDGDLFGPHWRRWALQEEAYVERERPRERAAFVLGHSDVSVS